MTRGSLFLLQIKHLAVPQLGSKLELKALDVNWSRIIRSMFLSMVLFASWMCKTGLQLQRGIGLLIGAIIEISFAEEDWKLKIIYTLNAHSLKVYGGRSNRPLGCGTLKGNKKAWKEKDLNQSLKWSWNIASCSDQARHENWNI